MARGVRGEAGMIEILTSDAAILLLSGLGLVATTVSIVHDARAQRTRATVEELPVRVEQPEKIAA